jgi:hypothetical protein
MLRNFGAEDVTGHMKLYTSCHIQFTPIRLLRANNYFINKEKLSEFIWYSSVNFQTTYAEPESIHRIGIPQQTNARHTHTHIHTEPFRSLVR